MPDIRIGIIGAGNCARALCEGIAWYGENWPEGSPTPAGLMTPFLGGYGVTDIVPVAAWDVNQAKVGKDLWTALGAGANLDVGIRLSGDAAAAYNGHDVIVARGPTMDGAGARYREKITLADDWPSYDGEAIVNEIRQSRIDLLVNYLPVGSQEAAEWWAQTALEAGVGFVNCVPVFIARLPHWAQAFRAAGLPLLGDDIKSQLGATFLHRAIASAFSDRGMRLDRTYQLNAGGNMDFYNMLEQGRLGTKRESKTGAVLDAYRGTMEPGNVHIGPSDYVGWLGDHKLAFIRCEGTGFAGVPISIEIRMDVCDSPNSAGVVVDAIRAAKLAADREDPAAADWCSAWMFKAPPRHVASLSDGEALRRMREWIDGTRP